jgi:putative NADH-flavin reductase
MYKMNVLLFGATGFTGRVVLSKLLASGHTVTALVRAKSRVQLEHPNLILIEGDVTDPDLIAATMEGQDAVINCLGKNKGSANDLISSLTEKIIGAMETKNVDRLIALSNVGAGDSYPYSALAVSPNPFAYHPEMAGVTDRRQESDGGHYPAK